MKNTLFICGFIVFKLASVAQSQTVVVDADWTVNTAIPDGSPVGITTSQTFQNLASGPITSVNVDLDISGGYNGDLYGYLTSQNANGNTATEVLLNQIGTSRANPFGSSGSGMNVTLSDSGTINGSIHNATGIPTGTWQPDSANTLDGTFGGLTANGTWTLFLADMSVGGGTSTLDSWGLDIQTVPEPNMLTLLSLGLSALGFLRRVCVRKSASVYQVLPGQ
jgi:subtilisin-like proprotein convertase family protein